MKIWLGVLQHRRSSFLNIYVMRNVRKQLVCCRNYHRKVKRRTQSLAQGKIDIDGILGAPSCGKPNVATNKEDTAAVEMWQGSDERTALLRKGEKRVAIIAVITCSSLLWELNHWFMLLRNGKLLVTLQWTNHLRVLLTTSLEPFLLSQHNTLFNVLQTPQGQGKRQGTSKISERYLPKLLAQMTN